MKTNSTCATIASTRVGLAIARSSDVQSRDRFTDARWVAQIQGLPERLRRVRRANSGVARRGHQHPIPQWLQPECAPLLKRRIRQEPLSLLDGKHHDPFAIACIALDQRVRTMACSG